MDLLATELSPLSLSETPPDVLGLAAVRLSLVLLLIFSPVSLGSVCRLLSCLAFSPASPFLSFLPFFHSHWRLRMSQVWADALR